MNHSGFLLIDKPRDWTSADVCRKVKKIFNTKKVGHTGTLDPFATGLLIVAVNRATRLIPYTKKSRKTYIAVFELGKTSPTLDPESDTIEKPLEKIPSAEEVKNVLEKHFVGNITQIPPNFSAVKINGKRAYDLARKSETFEIKPRETEVFSAEILAYNFPILELKITVAAGFYVRSLARDLAKKFRGGGMCVSLKRIAIEDTTLENAAEISVENLLPAEKIIHLEKIKLDNVADIKRFLCGNKIRIDKEEVGTFLVYDSVELLGVGIAENGVLRPKTMYKIFQKL